MLAKARIVAEITRTIRARRLSQTAAAKVLGLSPPKVSALLNGHFQSYSQERLIGLLNRLGCDVKIVVTPKPRSRTTGRVQSPLHDRHACIIRRGRIPTDQTLTGIGMLDE